MSSIETNVVKLNIEVNNWKALNKIVKAKDE